MKKPTPPPIMLIGEGEEAKGQHIPWYNEEDEQPVERIPTFCGFLKLHYWVTIEYTGHNKYQICNRCRRKRVVLPAHGYQPIKESWRKEVRIQL